MAAYQLRRCAQEAADAERAALLCRVRPAALPRPPRDPPATPRTGAPGGTRRGTAMTSSYDPGSGRCGKRRRLASERAEGAAGEGSGLGRAGLESGAEALSMREERAVALLALAATNSPPRWVVGSDATRCCAASALERRTRHQRRLQRPRRQLRQPCRGCRGVPAAAVGAAPAVPGDAASGIGLGLGLEATATCVLAALEPAGVRRVAGALAARFPRLAAALLCGGLPPAAAELLTARLEAADAALAAAGPPLSGPGTLQLRPCTQGVNRNHGLRARFPACITTSL